MMKKYFIIVIILVLFSLKNHAQENKLKLSAVSLAYGGFQPQKKEGLISADGIYAGLSLIMTLEKHRFYVAVNNGQNLDLFNDSGRCNVEFNLLYGRDIKLYKWIHLELAVGVGYFYSVHGFDIWDNELSYFENRDNAKINYHSSTVSLPLKSKLLFYTSSRFSLGANINVSINKIYNLTAYCFVAQWNF